MVIRSLGLFGRWRQPIPFEKIVAIAESIVLFIENIPETIACQFSQLFEFAITSIGHINHTVQEAGLAILFELIGRNSAQFVDHMARILNALVTVCELGHEPVVRSVLGFLTELLYVIEIPDNLIESILTIVSECLRHFPAHQDLVFTLFAALCESAGESIRPFVGVILILVRQAVTLSNPCGIEALGSLMAHAPVETAEFAESGPALFLECAASEDIFTYSSAIIALTSLARSPIYSVPPDATFSVLTKALELEVDPGVAIYESAAEAKVLALRFLTTLLRHHVVVVAPFALIIAPLIANHFDILHF
jgi:hypothetical protein